MPRVRNKGLNRGATRDIPQQETFRQGPGLNPREAPIGSTFVQPVRPLDASDFKKDAQAPQTIGNRFLDIARALGTFSEGLQSYVGLQETYAKLNAALGQADAISGKKFNRPNSFLNQGWGYDKGFEIAKGTEAGAKIQAEYLQRLQAANYGIEDITKDTAEQIKARRDELYNAVANDILGGASVSPDFLEGAADHMLSAKVAGEKAAGEAYQRQRIGKHLEVVTGDLKNLIIQHFSNLPENPKDLQGFLTQIRDGENETYNKFFKSAKERGFTMSREMFNETRLAVYEELITEWAKDPSKVAELAAIGRLVNAKDSSGINLGMVTRVNSSGVAENVYGSTIRSIQNLATNAIDQQEQMLTKLTKKLQEDAHTELTFGIMMALDNNGEYTDKLGIKQKLTPETITKMAEGRVTGSQLQNLVKFYQNQQKAAMEDDPVIYRDLVTKIHANSGLSLSAKIDLISKYSDHLSPSTAMSLQRAVLGDTRSSVAFGQSQARFQNYLEDRKYTLEQRDIAEKEKVTKAADDAKKSVDAVFRQEDKENIASLATLAPPSLVPGVKSKTAQLAEGTYSYFRQQYPDMEPRLVLGLSLGKHTSLLQTALKESVRIAGTVDNYPEIANVLRERFGVEEEGLEEAIQGVALQHHESLSAALKAVQRMKKNGKR